jgi:CubicO group peptidase (beta-lactamase class C family)
MNIGFLIHSAAATFARSLAALLLLLLPAFATAQSASGGGAGAGSGITAQARIPGAAAAIEALRNKLLADVAADSVGGITAAIVVGDRLIWAEGFGLADRDRKIPAGVETLYRVGSISKSFTAVAMAQLVQRGRIRLNDPVQNFLPEARNFAEPRAGAPPVTFFHLATHTSGLIREPRLQGAASGPIAQWEEKVIASIPTTSFDTVPGVRYSYSNIGYGTLGLAVSRAAGVPFMELVEREIFRPLGMHHSTFVVSPAQQHLLSVGYANGRDGSIDAETPAREHTGRGYKVPNGGIYSNVGDLARFIGGVTGAYGDAILNAQSRTLVLTRHTPPGGAGYGFGFSISNVRGVTIAGHGGSVSGYTAHIAFEPQSRVGVILLRNYGSGRTNLGSTANESVLAVLGK